MLIICFRRSFQEVEFCISNEVTFKQHVTVNTVVAHPTKRFGIDQGHIQRFTQQLKKLEVQGRKFRTKYQIAMTSGAPQAENFLWTILGNKVSLDLYCIRLLYLPDILCLVIGNERSRSPLPSL